MTVLERPAWMTVKEAARRLGVAELTVRRKIARGELRAVQLGGTGCALRILEEDLQSFIFGTPPERYGTKAMRGQSNPLAHTGPEQ
jgi:excisionase family DNA binding protein